MPVCSGVKREFLLHEAYTHSFWRWEEEVCPGTQAGTFWSGLWAHNRNQKTSKTALHPWMQNKSQPSQKTHSRQWLEYPPSLCFLSLREKSTKQNLVSHLVLFIPGSLFHASLTPSLSLSRSVFITTSPKKCTPWNCLWLPDSDTDMLAPSSARTTLQRSSEGEDAPEGRWSRVDGRYGTKH